MATPAATPIYVTHMRMDEVKLGETVLYDGELWKVEERTRVRRTREPAFMGVSLATGVREVLAYDNLHADAQVVTL